MIQGNEMTQQGFTTQEKPVALVTGANRSIGLQVAKELLANGYTVLVGARNVESGKIAAASLGGDAHFIHVNVTDQVSVTEAAAEVRTRFGRLDVLVNNAAIAHAAASDQSTEEAVISGMVTSATLEDVRKIWDTNVFSVISVTQAFLPLLLEAPVARIVNVSSAIGSFALNSDPEFPFRGGFGVYATSKTALNAITLAFAIELEKTNVHVEAASPGYTATAMNNFEGTDTIETGSRNIVRAALGQNGPSGTFSGSDGPCPW